MGRLNRTAATAAVLTVLFCLAGPLSILFAQTAPASPAVSSPPAASSNSVHIGPADHVLWVTVTPKSNTPATGAAKSQGPAGSSAPPSKPSWTKAAPALISHEKPGPALKIESASPITSIDGARGITPGEIALQHATIAERLDPFNWAVTVYKSRHQLTVYFQSHLYRSYNAVFGRNLDTTAKEYAGDRRTPEGLYTIIRKYRSRRFRWFLKLNYPNNSDIQRYDTLRAEHLVPIVDGEPVAPGGSIGIHGTDEPLLNAGDINWTTGCVSVSNDAISQLAYLLPIGTLVWIKP